MTDADIIIIGGGAAGLMAARELGRAGKKVMILEARERLGGRIHTLEHGPFAQPAEGGAEFIHGHLPITIGLLEEAGIGYHPISGDIWRFTNGNWKKEDDFMECGHLLASRLLELQEDIPVADFLERHFAGDRYANLRDSIRGYIEGYDSGDIGRASTFALRDEWTGEETGDQYRIDGGYIRLVRFLTGECEAGGCIIHTGAVVQHVFWKEGHCEVVLAGGKKYAAGKLLVTVPLGVLQAPPGDVGAITFSPLLPGKTAAIEALGFGAIIKILLEFDLPFWREAAVHRQIGSDVGNAGWIFSNATVPTWWTQLPDEAPLLTGWLGGPKARELEHADDKTIFAAALESLAQLFSMPAKILQGRLVTSHIINWPADPFTRGAYAYSTVHTGTSIQELSAPVAHTIYFAGEALHNTPQMGTVEGALASGRKAVTSMVNK